MPMLAIMPPNTMPGAKPLTISQRTAPRAWCARTLEMEVNMMVAMEVAIAILMARSAGRPRCERISVRKGPISMPPPMPKSPAK